MRFKKYHLFRQIHLRQGHAKKSFLSIRKNVSNVSSDAADIYDKRFLQEKNKHDEILIVVFSPSTGCGVEIASFCPARRPPYSGIVSCEVLNETMAGLSAIVIFPKRS